ncbi:MAG: 30S ribosomal protein S3 [Candidatus Parcubacteria bacterium]|nr:MAG: 30S ribosomal protein S3 [Candidatus Parcubacteria bacterium]
MGHKVSPTGLRLGINNYWKSRWLTLRNYKVFLEADYIIRKTIKENFPKASIVEIIIERKSLDICKLIIKTAKPAFLIGKEGQVLKNLIKKIEKNTEALFKQNNLSMPRLDVDIVEVKKPFLSAAYLAELAAIDIEKGMNTRKVLKKIIEKAKQSKEIIGIKVKASGRLEGATIKRRETIISGRMSLSKLIADIDYCERQVFTKSGIVGLKIWLYKGDKDNYLDLDNVSA